MALNKEKIVSAAEQLEAEGKNPSMAAVRERLGGGSYATISPVLRDWRNMREQDTVAILEMPTEIKIALEAASGKLWQAARDLTGRELKKIQQAARDQVADATAERDEAIKDIARLESTLATLQQDLNEQHVKLDAIREKQTQAARREGKLEAEFDAARSTISKMKKTIDSQTAKMAEMEKQSVEQQKTVAHLQGQLTARSAADTSGAHGQLAQYFAQDLDAKDRKESVNSTIRYIALLKSKGDSFAAIADKLNDDNYPTIDGKARWTWQAVKKYSSSKQA